MEKTGNRELHITKPLKASIEVIGEVWTHPKHILTWWGPNGFTTTINNMDVEQSGKWNLILHRPDGINYPNKSMYREIVPLKKIVYEHFNPNFTTTLVFKHKSKETLIEWTMLFETAELYDAIVKAIKLMRV